MKETLRVIGIMFLIIGSVIALVLIVNIFENEREIRRDCNNNTDFAYKFAGLPREQMNQYFKECVSRVSYLE